jgi:hypothetical protein
MSATDVAIRVRRNFLFTAHRSNTVKATNKQTNNPEFGGASQSCMPRWSFFLAGAILASL